MKERHLQIVEIINKRDQISVKELSELLNTSMVTIRKDLIELEQQGLLERVHGFAKKIPMDAIDARMAMYYPEKLAIAETAMGLVSPGETVMIESGSTCALFAKALEKLTDVTIITNSAYIARNVDCKKVHVILLGGDYNIIPEVTTGPVTRLCAQEYHVDKIFVGVDGYMEEDGFSNDNHTRCATVRDISCQADKIIVLTTSDKFGVRSVARMFRPEEVHTVVTDSNLSLKYKKILETHDINVIIADRNE